MPRPKSWMLFVSYYFNETIIFKIMLPLTLCISITITITISRRRNPTSISKLLGVVTLWNPLLLFVLKFLNFLFMIICWNTEDIGSFRGELLERLQEKREGLWKKWETEVSKLEGGWRPWRWWPGRPYARSVGLGAHCPAHRRLGLSKAVRSRWAGYLNTTDSQHWQHCSGVSHNWIFLDPIGSLASSVYITSNVQCVMCNM